MQCTIGASLQILLLLSLSQRACRAIDCYQCKSNEDKNCDTGSLDPKYLKPCPGSQTFCRKSEHIYYFTDSRDFITIRECALLGGDEKHHCYRGRYSRDSYQRVCECKDSGCNRSVNLATRVSTVLIISQLFICWIVP